MRNLKLCETGSLHSSTRRLLLLAALLVGCGGDDFGAIRVAVVTGGSTPDPDGYTVSVAGHDADIPVNGDITIDGVVAGNYTATLAGLSPNCAVTSENPVSVQLHSGANAEAAFSVACPAPALVRFTVTTSGSAIDPDGYLLSLSGVSAPLRVSANGTASATTLSVGPLAIGVSDIAPECAPAPANPYGVEAALDRVVEVALAFNCSSASGGLRVTVLNLPGLSTALTVDGGNAGRIGPGETQVTISRLPATPHTIAVYSCTLVGDNPHLVTIIPDVMTDITLSVASCDDGF